MSTGAEDQRLKTNLAAESAAVGRGEGRIGVSAYLLASHRSCSNLRVGSVLSNLHLLDGLPQGSTVTLYIGDKGEVRI